LKSLKFEAKALGLDAPWVSVLLAVMLGITARCYQFCY
jgi:hypothetical protein